MKRILVSLMFVLLCTTQVSAMNNYHQRLRASLVNVGKSIESMEVPVVGKLTNILPFALVAASFKECPLQTLAVLTGILAYVLSQNETVCSKLYEYNIVDSSWLRRNYRETTVSDDMLFIFEGENDDDAQGDNDTEDDLLFGDDENDVKVVKRGKKSTSTFL